MKTEILPKQGKMSVTLAGLFEPRLDQTRLLLLHELRRTMNTLPVTSETALALSLLLKNMDGKVALTTRVSNLARAYQRIYQLIINAATHDLQRFAKDLEGGGITTMTVATQVGLLDSVKDGVLTTADVTEILRLAVVGSGFDQTQENVVAALIRLAGTAIPLKSELAKSSLTDMVPAMIEASLLTRLMEVGRHLLAQPAQPVTNPVIPKIEAGVALRADAARKMGAILAFCQLAAVAQLRQHVQRLIQHPWFISQAHGRVADSIMRAIAEFKAREVDYPSFEQWPEFATEGLFDARLVPGWPSKPPAPADELTIPSTAWGDPLAGDYTIKVEISHAMVSHLRDVFWQLVEETEKAYTLWDSISGGEPIKPTFVTATYAISDTNGELATTGRKMTTLPIVSEQINRAVWYDDTNNWRLLSQPMRSWDWYTWAEALKRLKADASVGYVPVILTGQTQTMGLEGFKTLVPFFEVFDAPEDPTPKTAAAVANRWGLIQDEVDRHIQAMRGGANSTSMRMLAESLRFIGVLTLRPKAHKNDDMGVIVWPFERTYYHTQHYAAFTDMKNPIIMSTKRDVQINDAEITTVEVLLWPFTHIPTSADPQSVKLNALQVLPLSLQVANKPIVTYNVPMEHVKPAVPILGWKTIEEDVADVILIRTLPAKDVLTPIFIDSAETDQPQRARYFNAGIRISEPTSPSTIGSSIPLPSRYVSTGSDDVIPMANGLEAAKQE